MIGLLRQEFEGDEPAHMREGPEAWYIFSGEGCLETSGGKVHYARVDGPPMIVPTGPKMFLTTTGMEQRRATALILPLITMTATDINNERKAVLNFTADSYIW